MFKGVDIGIQQVAYYKLIPEYILLAYNCKQKTDKPKNRANTISTITVLFTRKLYLGLKQY